MHTARELQELYELLGPGTTLLRVPWGKKGCKMPGWPDFTHRQSLTPKYQSRLLAGNIGVLLGPASQDIVTCDWDTEEELAEFLTSNPAFKNTLITRGNRGANVILRMQGDYPQKEIVWKGIGEFRTARNQTVVSGLHPAGHRYKFLHKAPVMSARFPDIVWPRRVLALMDAEAGRGGKGEERGRDSSESLKPESLEPGALDAGPLGLCVTSADILRGDKAFKASHPVLHTVTLALTRKFLPLEEGSRNDVLTHGIAPALFYAFSIPAAHKALDYLIQTDQLGGYLAKDVHHEAGHVLKSMEREYVDRLPVCEADLYRELEAHEWPLFRICRSLAACDVPKYPPPAFFLSAKEAAGRTLEKFHMTSKRVLDKFVFTKILRCTSRGAMHTKEARGVAAEFAWGPPLLPLAG